MIRYLHLKNENDELCDYTVGTQHVEKIEMLDPDGTLFRVTLDNGATITHRVIEATATALPTELEAAS